MSKKVRNYTYQSRGHEKFMAADKERSRDEIIFAMVINGLPPARENGHETVLEYYSLTPKRFKDIYDVTKGNKADPELFGEQDAHNYKKLHNSLHQATSKLVSGKSKLYALSWAGWFHNDAPRWLRISFQDWFTEPLEELELGPEVGG